MKRLSLVVREPGRHLAWSSPGTTRRGGFGLLRLSRIFPAHTRYSGWLPPRGGRLHTGQRKGTPTPFIGRHQLIKP